MGTNQMVSLMGMPMPAPQKVAGMPPMPQPMNTASTFKPSAKPNIYNTGMYNMNPDQPIPDGGKPKDFASMMSQMENQAIQKKQQEQNDYDQEYDEIEQNQYSSQAQNMFSSLQQDPNALMGMLSQLSMNSGVDQSLINNLTNVIQKDFKNSDNTETVYSADGTAYKIQIDDKLPSDLEDDDDIIDYFLENNTDWTPCEYFLQGNCRYGDQCKYAHPESMRPKGFENGMGGFIKGQGP